MFTKDKISILFQVLVKNKIDPGKIIDFNKKEMNDFARGKKEITKASIKKLVKFFGNVKLSDVMNEAVDLLPLEEIRLKQIIFKLRTLNTFLKEKKGITLARAISAREQSVDEILEGGKWPSKKLLTKINLYFYLPPHSMTDDNYLLPSEDELRVDDDLCAIQRNDVNNQIHAQKHKKYIKRNFNILSYSQRFKMIFSLFLICIPLIGFTAFCSYLTINEKYDTIKKYKQGSDETEIYDAYSSSQTKYHKELVDTSKAHNSEAYYCDVTVGSKLYSINSIDASASTFTTKLELYYIFDKDEFRTMFTHYAENVLLDQVISDWESESVDNIFEEGRQTMADWKKEHLTYFTDWVATNDKLYYPGFTSSNVFTEKNSMFDVGNGSMVADTISYEKELEMVETVKDDGTIKTTCYQKMSFDAAIRKAFDSCRYPLDSVQFHIYIKPTMDAQYIRYLPDRSKTTSTNGSEPEYHSGFSPYFGITGGYKLLKESDDISNFTQKINYYKDVNEDPAISFQHTTRTQLEIIVRANRNGISLFLQAFINLFSVVIWITIAFYNQSYNHEDSIGMLGTGLFGVISSIIVGLSMISDAGIFSMITMINIFTLGVIMIMTYQSIAAKRANVLEDKIAIAYSGIKLRFMFFVLLICTAMMFFGLPLLSYMWGM